MMLVCELLDLPKTTKYIKVFKVGKKGLVVWTDVFADGDRKRIRISRFEGHYAKFRYVKPSTEISLVW